MKRSANKDVASLKAKFQQALETGRTQSVLRLARDIAQAEPQVDHSNLLRQAFRTRAEHLQREGQRSEAAVLWRNLLSLGEAPGIRELAAENLARCGFVSEAMQLIAALPADAPARSRIAGAAADAALEAGPEGKRMLSEEYHTGFDAVIQAYDLARQGRDDEARSAIQPIGLQSPFLEWKVFLRGLLAWYAGEDQRAVETWSRLQPHRLPWRLAAPLRLEIDAEFRQTQSAAAQSALRKAADRAVGSPDLELIRHLQAALAKPKGKKYDEVFRVCEELKKLWHKTHPDRIERLRRTVAGDIMQNGGPAELHALAKRFDADPFGPELFRLLAVGSERHGQPVGAVLAWMKYSETTASKKPATPHSQLAQALLWEHVGNVILDLDTEVDADDEDLDKLPNFDECFQRAIELAPDRKRPYLLRFGALADEPSLIKEAIVAGEALLQRFPDESQTLERLGDLYRRSNSPSKAFTAYERALVHDPLNRKLRRLLGVLSLQRAIAGTRTKLATQRADLAKAEELTPELAPIVFARRHFLEVSKGDPQVAAEAREKLLALPHIRLAAPFLLSVEGHRYGTTAADTKKSVMVLRSLEKPPRTPEEVTLLAEMLKIEADQSAEKNLVQAAWSICKTTKLDDWPERSAERLVLTLCEVPNLSGFLTFVRKAQKLHRKSPFLLLAEFLQLLRQENLQVWALRDLSEEMERLYNKLPRERQEEFKEQLAAQGLSLDELRRYKRPRTFLDAFFEAF
jgi:tetratricopeptide (TPR) repeat protein